MDDVKPREQICLFARSLNETRADSRAVVHLHSTHFVALSLLPGIDPSAALPPVTAYYVMKHGRMALIHCYRPGDAAVAGAIRGLAGRSFSVLLANHGPVVAGATLDAAVYATEELEETVRLYRMMRGLNPRMLTQSQADDLMRHFGTELPETPRDHDHPAGEAG